KRANAAKNGGSGDGTGDLFSIIMSVASQVLSKSSAEKGAVADMPYAMGVSELLALDDGSIIVLEREFYIPSGIVGARVVCKLYLVNPADCKPIAASAAGSSAGSSGNGSSADISQFSAAIPADAPVLSKRLLYRFTTAIKSLNDFNIANYEGMCLGPVLSNGNRTVILISDSQSGYKGILQDWFKVLEIK
ncbi:MAG: esterase-like activity of phytase family protein, partial [Bacteroidales bacterium]|nr:esterase-like activity of phytase family protein [Bacteroidales bacterium]